MRLPDVDVKLVRTPDDVATFMGWLDAELAKVDNPLAIDTETHINGWWITDTFVRLWQIGNATEGWAIPASWWGAVIHEAMRRIVERGAQVIFQNATFDMHAMRAMGWPVPLWSNVGDTMILLHLRRSNESKGLKGKQSAELLGKWVYHAKDNLKAVAKEKYGLKTSSPPEYWDWIPVDEPAYWAYGVFDTCLTRRLWDALSEVRTEFAAPYQREMHYQAIMHRVEERGLRIDIGYTEQLQIELGRKVEEDLLFLRANGLENPNSNQQIVALFENDFDWVPMDFTDTGNPSVAKPILEKLAKLGGLQTDVVEALLRFKRNSKWKSAYVDNFLRTVDRRGFVHPSVNTMEAITGRSSIRDPALQTLPSGDPMIRKCILPRVKQHGVWSIDYSAQEPRMLAHYGGAPALHELFATPGASIHDFIAERMFGPDFTKDQRAIAKVLGLSRAYGAGAAKMADASGLPVDKVQELIDSYDSIVGLDQINAHLSEQMKDRTPPYVVTSGGRHNYVDEEYKGVNSLIQGSAADETKDAAIRLDLAGLSDLIMVPVHDEFVYSIPRDEEEDIVPRIVECMEDRTNWNPPLIVDAEGPGVSWGALYE